MPPSSTRVHHLFTRFGGVAGLFYSTLPIVTFITANTYVALVPAVTMALGTAAVVLAWRLFRRESYQPAIAGFLGVAVGATLSLFTGQSKDYFIIHIWISLLCAVVFTASILLRRPLVGHIWSWTVSHNDTSWRRNIKSHLAFDFATLVWATVFATRFLVQHHFYTTDQTTWLGVARIAMGWPLTGLAALATYLAIRVARSGGHRDGERSPA